ncbi:MAG: hypothetical protein KME67_10810 [Candidatus Thiodiazotropha sp. (ex Codakia orbicularis)]|nr:hypothetical protein [Candidatus Thiodiazotropha sp. (ex Codakia orbicularis)]
MASLNDKLSDLREEIDIRSDYIQKTVIDIGQAANGKVRLLSGSLKESREELAEMFRKETILLELIDNE